MKAHCPFCQSKVSINRRKLGPQLRADLKTAGRLGVIAGKNIAEGKILDLILGTSAPTTGYSSEKGSFFKDMDWVFVEPRVEEGLHILFTCPKCGKPVTLMDILRRLRG